MNDLERFVDAQAPVAARVAAELDAGCKRTHWMWFVFPQLRGLGSSPMAQRFGIASLDEARAYLAHPLLGERLRTDTQRVLAVQGRSLREIFGTPDDVKFCSCMTLFATAASDATNVFAQALERYCGGRMDDRTLGLLHAQEMPAGADAETHGA